MAAKDSGTPCHRTRRQNDCSMMSGRTSITAMLVGLTGFRATCSFGEHETSEAVSMLGTRSASDWAWTFGSNAANG